METSREWRYNAIVVGAGGMGSSACARLARLGLWIPGSERVGPAATQARRRRLGRTLRLAAALAIVMALTGQGVTVAVAEDAAGPPSTHRGDPARTGRHPGPSPEGEVAPRWQAVLARHPNEGSLLADLAVVDGRLYAGVNHPDEGGSGALVALDALTGTELWRVEPGLPVVRSPSVADGVVFGTASGWEGGPSLLFAVDAATGAERWRFEAPGAWASPTAVVDGVVYFGDGAGTHAVDAATGVERWSVAHAGALFSVPAVADGTVYVAAGEGTLLALDAATGGLRWRFDAGAQLGTPTVAEGRLYATTFDFDDYFGEETANAVIALDPTTGRERWRAEMRNAALSPEVGLARGRVVVAAATVIGGHYVNVLAAFDAASGRELWRTPLEDEADDYPGRSPVVAGDIIYAGLSDIRVSNAAGKEVARYGGNLLDPDPMLLVNRGDRATPDPTRLSSANVSSLADVGGVLYVVASSFDLTSEDRGDGQGGVTVLIALGGAQ
jgi:outer membrane protein assembly factor BamB